MRGVCPRVSGRVCVGIEYCTGCVVDSRGWRWKLPNSGLEWGRWSATQRSEVKCDATVGSSR
jgi:hypothetical protein